MQSASSVRTFAVRGQHDHGGAKLLRVGADDAADRVCVGREAQDGVASADARHVLQQRHQLAGDELLGSLALSASTAGAQLSQQVQAKHGYKAHPQLLCLGVGHRHEDALAAEAERRLQRRVSCRDDVQQQRGIACAGGVSAHEQLRVDCRRATAAPTPECSAR